MCWAQHGEHWWALGRARVSIQRDGGDGACRLVNWTVLSPAPGVSADLGFWRACLSQHMLPHMPQRLWVAEWFYDAMGAWKSCEAPRVPQEGEHDPFPYLLSLPLQVDVCYEQDKLLWGTESRQTDFLLLSLAWGVLSRLCSSFWILVAWTPLTGGFCLFVFSCFNFGPSSKTCVTSAAGCYLWKKLLLKFV